VGASRYGTAHTSRAIWGTSFAHLAARPRNELYDEACALVAAAQGLRAAAGPRRSAPAIAASLSCVEASLEALADAVTSCKRAALAPNRRSARGVVAGEALKIRASFAQLARDLSASQSSCAAVRERVGPVLANR
jgi:hypothetical protein